jgi:hypothetical protein
MAPDIGLAEGHGMKRQAEVATGDPGTGNFAGIGIVKHFMGWFQLVRVHLAVVVVVMMIVCVVVVTLGHGGLLSG